MYIINQKIFSFIILLLKLALDVLSRVDQLPQAQGLFSPSNGKVLESYSEEFSIVLLLTKIIIKYMNQRFSALIDDPNLNHYLDLVKLLLKFVVNGYVNIGIATQKSTEEINRNLNGTTLRTVFQFISDFLSSYVISFFFDTKYFPSLMFPIRVAASIPNQFSPFAETYLIQRFSEIFTSAINTCIAVCDIQYLKP